MNLPNLKKIKELWYIPNHILQELISLEKIKKLREISYNLNWKNILITIFSFIASIYLSVYLENIWLARETAYMWWIFLMAVILWATEALPLFATAILILFAEIILLANPGWWENFWFVNWESPTYQSILSSFSNPIIFLFLWGFILSQAIIKQWVDKKFAWLLLKLFWKKPIWVILGFMSITAFLSMWMSNTATTAMMITLTIPLITQIPKLDSLKKALIISIPIAANIWWMATPIWTPPNAVTIWFLKTKWIEVGFIDWMLVATPIMIFLLFIWWLLIWFMYKPKSEEAKNIKFELPESNKITIKWYFIIFIFILTVILWLTEKIHNIPSAIVAFIPAIAFTAIWLTDRHDINSLDWNILILIAGWIALWNGMQITWFSDYIINLVPIQANTVIILLWVMTLGLSIIMSNTAATNIVLPIWIWLATSMSGWDDILTFGVIIALSASLAMALPVSTPPNVIAYSKWYLTTKDFLKIWLIIWIIWVSIVIFFSEFLINFWIK